MYRQLYRVLYKLDLIDSLDYWLMDIMLDGNYGGKHDSKD